jgi:hypothetical protein
MHHGSIADTVNHLAVTEFFMQRVPCIYYISIMVTAVGPMLHEAGGIG